VRYRRRTHRCCLLRGTETGYWHANSLVRLEFVAVRELKTADWRGVGGVAILPFSLVFIAVPGPLLIDFKWRTIGVIYLSL
jgi:hypothetical protein